MEEEPGTAPSLRQSNRLRVIQALQVLGVTSRADVARYTRLSRSTVSTIVAALQAEGIVVDRDPDGRPTAGGGRPPAPIALYPAAGLALGVDFGKRHLAVALADLSHELLAEEWSEMPDDLRPFLIGFAAESDDLEANARSKLRDKGLDLIVGNTVGGPFDAIGSDDNKVTVFGAEGALTDWPMLPKRQVAERLWDLIVDRYRKARPEPTETPPAARSRRR